MTTTTTTRLDTLHSQLNTLLENAQYLLLQSDPTFQTQNNYYNQSNPYGNPTSKTPPAIYSLISMQSEIRTLEFWRSIICECTATFFYVLIVLSIISSSNDHNVQTNSAIGAGLAMAMLTGCFGRVSGCHCNPAVSLALIFTKHISPLRSILFMCAQCGGGIAGKGQDCK